MNLELDLSEISKEDQLPFCYFIISTTKALVLERFDINKAKLIEDFINNNIFPVRSQKQALIDIYTTALNNLLIKKIGENRYLIEVDRNISINEVNLLSLIKLSENGNLILRKYDVLTQAIKDISKDIDTYYNMYELR